VVAHDPVHVAVSGDTGGLARRVVRRAVARVVQGERQRASIAVTFVSKREMQRLNADHLHHDYPTDVISFPLTQPDGSVAGDIYVCRHVAARQARAHQVTVRAELLRLVVHGTLHVLGWDHPAGAGRTASAMWRKQEQYVAALT
jgi:probable rRNA maturation factor